MAKYTNKKFIADAFVTREYKCAVVLEEYLSEINDLNATRYAIKTLQNFNRIFKDIKTMKNNEYVGSLVVKEFEKRINKDDKYAPDFVRSLILNVIKTKFKMEIIRKEN